MALWLTSAGGVSVQRLDTGFQRTHTSSDLTKPRKGVLHTPEGGWDGSLSVFRDRGTPTFMVGRNDAGKVSVAQFMPLGERALTLLDESTTPLRTNHWAVCQIELVGFSKRTAWFPEDAVAKVLADVVRQASAEMKIPLRRGGDGTRSVTRWTNEAGWFGHIEVPENSHWDPGTFEYKKLWALAAPAPTHVRFELWARRRDTAGKWQPYLVDKSAIVPLAESKARSLIFGTRLVTKVAALAATNRRPNFRRILLP
jgi:hypothetical protein